MEAEAVLAEATEAYRAAMGDRLVAAYALGSLAHGGFSALVSDIDLGLILSDPLCSGDPPTIETIAANEKAKGSALHQRLSVFWEHLPRSGATGPAGGCRRSTAWTCSRTVASCTGPTMRAMAWWHPSSRDLLVSGAKFALDYLAGSRRPAPPPVQGLGSMRPAGADMVEEIRSSSVL